MLTPTAEDIKTRHSTKEMLAQLVGTDAHGNPYCPFCDTGRKDRGTSAVVIYEDETIKAHAHCHSCNETYDIFAAAGKARGLESFAEQHAEVCRLLGVVQGKDAPTGTPFGFDDKMPVSDAPSTPSKPAIDQTAIDAFKREEHDKLDIGRVHFFQFSCAREFMRKRGFTDDEIDGFHLGYDPVNMAVMLPYWDPSPDRWAHNDRKISFGQDKKGDYKWSKPKLPKGMSMPVDGACLLQGSSEESCIWIVEGLIDRMSLQALGHDAIALDGTATKNALDAITASHYKGTVIVCTDFGEYDEEGKPTKGRKAAAELKAKLDDVGIRCTEAPELPNNAHDVNDAFVRNRSDLQTYAEQVEADARAEVRKAKEEEFWEHARKAGIRPTMSYIDGIVTMESLADPLPTGLDHLDESVGGGLPAGITFVGGQSALGKTTLLNQIADHAAENGKPVLFASLEQSAEEHIAKSLSRILARDLGCTVSSGEILNKKDRDRYWGVPRNTALKQAVEIYRETIAPRMFFKIPIGLPTAEDVVRDAGSIADLMGEAPFVVLDYLQLLAPADPHYSDKRATDESVTKLRQLSRDLHTQVLAVSSLNRQSYSGCIQMESFKESGTIEYSSDLLIGLEPAGIRGHDLSEEEVEHIVTTTRADRVKQLEISVLKLRNGPLPTDPIVIVLDSLASTFKEPDAPERSKSLN